jgi:hypothetical protein
MPRLQTGVDVAVGAVAAVAVAAGVFVTVGVAVATSSTAYALVGLLGPLDDTISVTITRASPAPAATAHNQDPFHLSILSLLLN